MKKKEKEEEKWEKLKGRLRGRSGVCAATMGGLTGCFGDSIQETPCKFRNRSACSRK